MIKRPQETFRYGGSLQVKKYPSEECVILNLCYQRYVHFHWKYITMCPWYVDDNESA